MYSLFVLWLEHEDLTPEMQDTVYLGLNGKDRGKLSVKDALQHISAERESIDR